ncbi:Transcriptional regulator BlaI [Symmachiella macrocystis]|uniref:Transcriptional regulator BlaI n=1 Tax=Symmachiella macrocystis TaxID=2527985 RepID=A0A5C6BJ84_9PLAN|nr:BlaI/MecI/CopY family transcriptional regulator [Symmachiella macrocystis]TWU12233.1 Transcriptional regulator BlaI [Symmachiella macrocystis]
MAKSETKRPTDAELEILRVLWDRGPSTVRDVLDELSRTRDIGYTTVLKLMQIMTDKSLVARDESNRSHVYRACHKQGQTQRQLVADLLQRAFGGAADKLVMQALQLKKVSADDMAKIRELLDDLED